MKTSLKLVVSVLAVLAAACGATRANSARSEAAAECSLSLAPHSDASAIRSAIEAVAAGSLDPCSGALAQREAYSPELMRIDQPDGPDGFVMVVYRMMLLHPERQKPQTP